MADPTKPAPISLLQLGGLDVAKMRPFYETVFGWTQNGFLMPVPISSPALVNFGGGPGAMLAFIGVPDVDACLDAVVANGGERGAPPPIKDNKGVTTVAYFVDPGGNQMALTRWDPASAEPPPVPRRAP